MSKEHYLLFEIANGAGLFGSLRTSTREMAAKLKVSQQSISRILRDMEKKELIKRETSPTGVVLSLKKKGVASLEEEYTLLKRIFEKKVNLSGRIADGFGEGRYYVRKYTEKIKNTLGIRAYPGTLNVIVDEIKAKEFIQSLPKIRISEFTSDERSFGGVDACPIRINNTINGAILLPDRTRHPSDTIEIISNVNIRTALKLSAGDKIVVS